MCWIEQKQSFSFLYPKVSTTNGIKFVGEIWKQRTVNTNQIFHRDRKRRLIRHVVRKREADYWRRTTTRQKASRRWCRKQCSSISPELCEWRILPTLQKQWNQSNESSIQVQEPSVSHLLVNQWTHNHLQRWCCSKDQW